MALQVLGLKKPTVVRTTVQKSPALPQPKIITPKREGTSQGGNQTQGFIPSRITTVPKTEPKEVKPAVFDPPAMVVTEKKSDMPLPLIIGAAGSLIGKVVKGGAVKKIGSFIGGLFKSKKKKKAEKAAAEAAQAAAAKAASTVFATSPSTTSGGGIGGGIQNLGTGEQATKKPVPVWAWVAGGVAVLGTILFLLFKRKR